MKVYRFYIKRKEIPKTLRHSYEKAEYVLYAYTNDKNLAANFEENHNMELFRKRVVHMDKEEFLQMRKAFQLECLEWAEYLTVTNREQLDERPRMEAVHVSVTLCEREAIEIFTESPISDQVTMFFPLQFNDEIIEALGNLGYIAAYKLFIAEFTDSSFFYENARLLDEFEDATGDSYDISEIAFDELAIYTMLCANILK